MSTPQTIQTSEPPRLRRPGRSAMTGLALVMAGTLLGLWVTRTGPVSTGELGIDQHLAIDREGPIVWAARLVNMALGPVIGPLGLVVVATLVALRHRMAALVLVVATITGWLSVGIGKIAFARPRPVTSAVHALVVETGRDSFPSGHTAFAAALVVGIVLALRTAHRPTRWAWLVGVPFAAFVAFTRLYLGAHYLGDVVASFAYVGGSMLIALAVWSEALRRHLVPRRVLAMTR